MGFAPEALSRDRFLGGALEIIQPQTGYRAGVDPVLLAASVPAEPGQSVLELGCGVAVASLCLGKRVGGLALSGIELQADYAGLAVQNAASNDLRMAVFQADLRNLPDDLRALRFDHIIANPPYFSRATGTASANPGRDVAFAGDTPLEDWVAVAAKRLLPRGYLSVIVDIRRLPELLCAVAPRLGSIELQPLAARRGRAPHLLLMRARKGGRAAFIQHFPLVMHEGDRHTRDGESYTAQFRAILRDGAALPFGTG